MKRLAVICVLGMASISVRAEWLTREFINASAPVQGIEEFLNNECRPATLEDIRMFGVQNGHSDALHIHVYCRRGAASHGRYQVTLAQFPRARFADVVQRLLDNPNARFGPFYLVVIEKAR